jgi:hypothetical protein
VLKTAARKAMGRMTMARYLFNQFQFLLLLLLLMTH